MDVYNIKEFTNGWFVGNFRPAIFENPFFEVAHHRHEAGYKGPKHTHKVATEINYIVKGSLKASGKILHKGDFFVYHTNEVADVVFLEDTDLIVIKWPSVPSDKHSV